MLAGYSFLILTCKKCLVASSIFSIEFFMIHIKGVRRLGAAAVDMSHVAMGITEAYWEYRLKPWDMAAGVLVLSVINY